MKKFVYILVASLALVACTPKNGVSNKVRIAVSFEDEQQPNTGQQRISAVDRVLEGKHVIDVKWEDKDVLYWNTGDGIDGIDTQNPFKIVSGVDTKSAFFENEDFIGHKDVFTLYYHGAAEPYFENPLQKDQVVTFNENGEIVINNDYFMYTATNCKIGSAIKLEPNFAVLGVKIMGEATNLNHMAGHYAILGEGKASNQNVYISCEINGATQKDELTYYYVIPYKGDEINLQGKYFWIANKNGQNEYSNEMLIKNPCVLTPGVATIIELYLTKYDSDPGDIAYTFTLSSTKE